MVVNIDKSLLRGSSSDRLQNTSQIIPCVLIAIMAQNRPSNLLTHSWNSYETCNLFVFLGIDFVASDAISKFPFSDINSNLILSQESSKRLIIGFDFSYLDLRESNDHCPRMTVD